MHCLGFLALFLFFRIDSLDQKAKSNGGITARNSCGSPEFHPPSKIQRLAKENEEKVGDKSADLELQALQVDQTFTPGKSSAADQLKSMKEKHDQIEDLLVTLEAHVRSGQNSEQFGLISKDSESRNFMKQ